MLGLLSVFFWIYPIITDLFIMWRGGDYPKMKTTKDIHATLMITLVHPERNDFNHVDELWHISIYPKITHFSCVIKVSYLTRLPLQINVHSLKVNWKRKIVPNHSQQLLFFGSLKILSIGGQGELLRRSSLIPSHVWFHHPVFRRKPMRPKSSPHQFSFVFQLICLFLCIFPSSLGDQASECIGPSGAFNKEF